MMPLARILENWSSAVFFTIPRRVAKNTYLPAVSFGTGMNADKSFVVGETQQVGDRASARGASALGQFVRLFFVNFAGAGEEHQPVMRADRHQVLDEVLFAGGRADFAATAAPLRAIERERRALDIAAVSDGDQHVFFDDQILDREVAFGLDDLRAALIGEFLFDVFEFRGDESSSARVRRRGSC